LYQLRIVISKDVGKRNQRNIRGRQMKRKIVAIACSDIHLSHNAPAARSAETDWYEAMSRPLWEIGVLAAKHEVPVICTGDIFDRWNSPIQLVNWAVDNLPPMTAIPGQHDLPYHSIEEIHKSAYYNLVQAKLVRGFASVMCGTDFAHSNGVMYHLFPWGKDVIPCPTTDNGYLNVAVIHSYIWTGDCKYIGAPKEANKLAWMERLKGYDVALFGDNHKGFIAKAGDCTVVNCGTLMARRSDERDYKPFVVLLYSDGEVERHYLDISEDKWIEEDSVVSSHDIEGRLSEFLDELEELDDDNLDFRAALNRVRTILLEAMGE
jgi:DNA repair exonuclease SbcCD nuclease subunit